MAAQQGYPMEEHMYKVVARERWGQTVAVVYGLSTRAAADAVAVELSRRADVARVEIAREPKESEGAWS